MSQKNPFGVPLAKAVPFGRGPTMDVAVDQYRNLAIACGWGSLSVFDLTDIQAHPLLGRLSGLGNARKVVLSGNLAYIAAREDGVWVVDLSNPRRPEILSRYDTIEWASGLSIDGPLLAVACRQHGVELVDISNPGRAKHFSTFFRGHEAQSPCLSNGILYAGIWHEAVVLSADLRGPHSQNSYGRADLDGYGDGVTVQGGLLYAATGHHSRAYRGEHNQKSHEGSPGFGTGHGLEIFDVRDPLSPKRLGGIKAPVFYYGVPDLWSVKVSGTRALLADTYNGAFIIDVSDPGRPGFLTHHQLPENERVFGGGLGPDAVVGADICSGGILLAGYKTDLFFEPTPGLIQPGPPPKFFFNEIPKLSNPEMPESDVRIYQPQGQVHDVVDLGHSRVALAAGTDGIHILRIGESLERLDHQQTKGRVNSLSFYGDRLYAAEGLEGFSVWQVGEDGRISLLSRHLLGASVQQIVVHPPGRYALLKEGMHLLTILDLSALPEIKRVLQTEGPGHFVGDSICSGLFQDRYAGVFWGDGGPAWFDLAAAPPVPVGPIRNNLYLGINQGMVANSKEALVLRDGGLLATRPGDTRELKEVPVTRVEGLNLCGQPTLQGNSLFVSLRAEGLVSEVNVADSTRPILKRSFHTPGNPTRVLLIGKSLVIADGYAGLRVLNLSSKIPSGASL